MNYYLRLLRWPSVGEESVNFVREIDGYRIFAIASSSSVDTGIKIQPRRLGCCCLAA